MKSAFVAIDVQGVWARNNPVTTEAISRAADIARQSMPVIWVYTNWIGVHAPFQAEKLRGNRFFDVFNKAAMNTDRDSPAIVPAHNDWILTKANMSLFSNRDTKEFLKTQGFDRLIFAGFMTSQCVLFSAREAASEFIAEAVIDLMADKDDENFPDVEIDLQTCGVKPVRAASLGLA